MRKFAIALLLLTLVESLPAHAYYQGTAGATGRQRNTTRQTGGSLGWTRTTGANAVMLPKTAASGLAGVYGGFNGLPPTRLDSFVKNAGGLAEAIYGDEGINGPPKINGFNEQNRIDYGITNSPNNEYLTTGHTSLLPSAWGSPNEMYVSGDHVIRNENGEPVYSTFDFRVDRPDRPSPVEASAYYPGADEFPGASGK